jgi:hypothetical protein
MSLRSRLRAYPGILKQEMSFYSLMGFLNWQFEWPHLNNEGNEDSILEVFEQAGTARPKAVIA